MRIAIIINTFPGQSQIFVYNMIAGLIDEGHTVDIYATNVNPDRYHHAIVNRYELMSRVHRYGSKIPIKRWKRVVTVLGHAIRYPHSIKAIWKSLFISQPGKLDFFLKYRPFFRKIDYDVIHPQFLRECSMVYKLREIGLLQGKVCTSVRGFDLSHWIKKQKGDPIGQMIKQGCFFLPVSESFKEELIKLGCPPEQIRVVRSGMQIEDLPFQPRKISAGQKIRGVSVGRLVEKKGHIYGIQVVHELRQREYDVEYEIIGEGKLQECLEAEITRLNAEDYIQVTGALLHEEVIENLNHKDIFLAPHVTAENGDQEGIPNSIKEAMALGLPVFATKHSGIPELVRDGETGFLSEEKDIWGMVEMVIGVLELGIDEEMLHRARAEVVAGYDQQKVTEHLVEAYKM